MNLFSKNDVIPVFSSYLILILIVVVSNNFLSYEYVLSISASAMILIPILLKKDEGIFSFNFKGFLNGVLATVLLVCLYALITRILPFSFGNDLDFSSISISLVLINFLLVAVPEEIFFRGYLQKQLGNTIWSIVIVSLLFAIAHFITICVFRGPGLFVCSINILTFFPSLIMGFLYYKTKTLWSSIFFHSVANVAHTVVLSG